MCDYDWSYEEISSRRVVTRKVHECGSCLSDIPRGTTVVVAVGLTDGEIGRTYACPACHWALQQADHSDLHLCWGWRWNGDDDYPDGTDRWNYITEMLAAKLEPSAEHYRQWRDIPGNVERDEEEE